MRIQQATAAGTQCSWRSAYVCRRSHPAVQAGRLAGRRLPAHGTEWTYVLHGAAHAVLGLSLAQGTPPEFGGCLASCCCGGLLPCLGMRQRLCMQALQCSLGCVFVAREPCMVFFVQHGVAEALAAHVQYAFLFFLSFLVGYIASQSKVKVCQT